MTSLKHSPLHDRHVALGAKMAPFGGWEMPLEYAGSGVLKEHAAVRDAVGLFDVSHLGKATVRGPGAVDYLNARLSNDLNRIGAGQAQYTLCCTDEGGVVDDLIAYRYADDHVFLIPNAANTEEVVRRLSAELPDTITITNEHEAYAVLAVQGPHSPQVLGALNLPTEHAYLTFTTATLGADIPVVVLRTGYTGARGYELVVASKDAGTAWDALVKAGEPYGLLPAGLAARDTLRTEMGYPLHGQELSTQITPVEAGLSWAVGWDKPAFWGRDALLAEKAAGPRRRLWGLTAIDRGIPRPHMAALARDAESVIGEVTSGTFSPTLKTGIALALLDTSAGLNPGDEIEVDVRGRRTPMRVIKPPFIPPSVRE
jgi:aminomethyltransferase